MPSSEDQHSNHGFTLLEILLVVGIIAILAGIVIIAINPTKQLASVRNVQRKANLAELNKALYQYYIDHSSYPATLTSALTEICATGATTTPPAGGCGTLIDLSALVPTYLTAIPADPQGSTLSLIPVAYATTNGTGYKVMKDLANKVVLTAPQAENNVILAIGTWCPSPLVDSRDGGKTYTTVAIGTQCWMQQNLNVGTLVNSCTPNYTGVCTTGGSVVQNQTNNSIIEKYCYNNIESGCDTNGGLYQWNEAMQYVTTAGAQGICPTGWHVPTDDEYKTLEIALGMCTGLGSNPNYCADDGFGQWRGTTQGDQLKNTGLCGGRTPCNTSGFTALLAGYRYTGGSFGDLGSYTFLWSSLQLDGTSAWRRYLDSGYATVNRDYG